MFMYLFCLLCIYLHIHKDVNVIYAVGALEQLAYEGEACIDHHVLMEFEHPHVLPLMLHHEHGEIYAQPLRTRVEVAAWLTQPNMPYYYGRHGLHTLWNRYGNRCWRD